MFKNISKSVGILAIGATLAFVGYFAYTQITLQKVEASEVCNPTNHLTGSITDAAQGKATVTNSSNDCTYTVDFKSNKMFGPINYNDVSSNQERFDTQTKTVGPKQTVSFDINVPSCATQLDLSNKSTGYPYDLIKWDVSYKTGYCTNTPPPPVKGCIEISKWVYESDGTTRDYSNLSGFTFKLKQTGAEMTTGSNGVITFSNLATGHYVVIESARSGYTTVYPADGSLDIDVTQASADGCAHGHFTNKKVATQPPTLTVSCAADASTIEVGYSTIYRATAQGGTGSYTYTWSGDDNLSASGVSVSKRYTTEGTKNAHVHVTSGSQTADADCHTTVNNHTTYDFSVSCEASRSTIQQYDTLTYTAHISGGNGSYTYSWSGTEDLSGSNSSVYKYYSTSGTKYADVAVTSNGVTHTAHCSVYVNPTQHSDDFSGYCYANVSQANINDTVTWYAIANNASNSVYYSWTGWDGLSGNGNSVSKSYTYSGQKSAEVAITSNGHTIYKDCYVNIVNQSQTNNFYGSCTASQATAYVGDRITWSANGYNSNYGYSYSWNGTDGVTSSRQSFTVGYNTPGQKTATVTIYSNGQSVQQTCSINIINRPIIVTNTEPTQPGGVYLSQVPYTGIGSNMKVALFVLGLIAWSSLVAYFLLKRKASKQGLTISEYIANGGMTLAAAGAAPVDSRLQDVVEARAANPMIPQAEYAEGFMSDLETRARASKMIISEDGLRMIAIATGRDHADATAMIDNLATMYRSNVADASDWVTLNAEKVSKVIHG